MNITEYVEKAQRTNHTPRSRSEAYARITEPDSFDMNHAIVGMLTELGEFADCFKKNVQYGKDIDWINAAEEMGDMMWYMAIASKIIEQKIGVDMEQLLGTNIQKLRERFPGKFEEGRAINRDVSKERVILEGNA